MVTVLDAAHDLTPFFRVHTDCCFAQKKPLFLLRLNTVHDCFQDLESILNG